MIEWQVWALTQGGVDDIAVVVGYHARDVQDLLKRLEGPKLKIRTIFNPFYKLADNLASCWMARHEMKGEFIQVNGDNLFKADLVKVLLAAPAAPVTVAINHKPNYDADDMKVMMDGERLTEIGKTLPAETVNAEAIGFYVFRADGAKAYVETLDRAMREPAGLKQWFPAAVGMLAKNIAVRTVALDGIQWCEVDFPVDLQQARQLVSSW